MALDQVTHPVTVASAPWTTKAECYWMFLTLGSLPKGLYDPLEEPWSEHGEFKGGLGIIMVVRYKETPVVSTSSWHQVHASGFPARLA